MENKQDTNYGLQDLRRIMERLRSPDGCPWDRVQDHKSLRSSLLEETYEVLDGIEEDDMGGLCEELGDLLLQIIFHAHLAEEKGQFSLEDVVNGICTKLIRRHPHVFVEQREEDVEGVLKTWARIKQEEKGASSSILQDVSSRQPALMWAFEVQKKAAGVGFDWEDVMGAWEKLKEEIEEMEEEIPEGDNVEEELGDLFFSLVNVSRLLKLSPEVILQQAVKKFIQRFQVVEEEVLKKEKEWDDIPLEQLENYWEKAKGNDRKESRSGRDEI